MLFVGSQGFWWREAQYDVPTDGPHIVYIYIHMCLSFFVKILGVYAVCRFPGVLVEGGTV